MPDHPCAALQTKTKRRLVAKERLWHNVHKAGSPAARRKRGALQHPGQKFAWAGLLRAKGRRWAGAKGGAQVNGQRLAQRRGRGPSKYSVTRGAAPHGRRKDSAHGLGG